MGGETTAESRAADWGEKAEAGKVDPPDVVERRAIKVRLSELSRNQDLKALDALFQEARSSRAVMADGLPLLSHLYDVTPEVLRAEWGILYGELDRLYTDWINRFPESPTPLILRGRGLIESAWRRPWPSSAVDSIRERTPYYVTSLNPAEASFLLALELGAKDPDAYAQLIVVADGKSLPAEEIEAYLEKGLAIDPFYFLLHENYAVSLLPVWEEDAEALRVFATESADRVGGEDGDMIYARIARAVFEFVGADKFSRYGFDASRIRSGYARLQARFPKIPKLYAQEMELARALGRNLLSYWAADHLGPRWLEYYWDTPDHLEVWKKLDPRGSALLDAAWEGYPSGVEELLAQGVDVDVRNSGDQTPLYLAALRQSEEIVRILLDNGANPDAVAKASPGGDRASGLTPLSVAAYTNDKEIIRLLLNAGGDPNLPQNEHNPLKVAVRWGYRDLIELLLERGADVNLPGPRIGTPLQDAVRHDRLLETRTLLQAGANPNAFVEEDVEASYFSRMPPLMQAAKLNNLALIELLLEYGANPNVLGPYERTPLIEAVLLENLDVARVLLDAGADIRFGSVSAERDLLEFALFSDHTGLFEFLLERGANPDLLVKGEGADVFARFVQDGSHDVVRLMLERGASPDAGHSGNNPPVFWAIYNEDASMLKLLIEFGLSLNSAKPGELPLEIAVGQKRPKMVKLLLDAGADPTVKYSGIYSVLDMAAHYGDAETVRILQDHCVDHGIPFPEIR